MSADGDAVAVGGAAVPAASHSAVTRRTRSRSAAVSPPPLGYLMTPAYRMLRRPCALEERLRLSADLGPLRTQGVGKVPAGW
jgi:hypothetical protein